MTTEYYVANLRGQHSHGDDPLIRTVRAQPTVEFFHFDIKVGGSVA